jgi:hypothetical protein
MTISNDARTILIDNVTKTVCIHFFLPSFTYQQQEKLSMANNTGNLGGTIQWGMPVEMHIQPGQSVNIGAVDPNHAPGTVQWGQERVLYSPQGGVLPPGGGAAGYGTGF